MSLVSFYSFSKSRGTWHKVVSISRPNLRATSHIRLRARDHYTSSTLIGGKGGDSPSSLHTMLKRGQQSMEMQDGCKVYIDSYMASNSHLEYFQKPPLGDRSTTKSGDHGTLNAHNC